jgi:hypothetical protein
MRRQEHYGYYGRRTIRPNAAVRYVAFYQDGNLFMHKRPGIGKATTRESDQYEELLVNPTVLTLTGKRET